MRKRSSSPTVRSRPPWAAIAGVGQVHWLFGNLYEAIVDVPQLLMDAHPNRPPGLLGAGSPVRYYLPAAPLTLAATTAALVDSWRAGGDRREILTAAAGTVSATAITGYLVRNVNRRLLQSPEPLRASESRRLVSRWHRGNLLRLLALAIAALALRRAAPTGHR
jgi:Domain of unknown function (DUF1772)